MHVLEHQKGMRRHELRHLKSAYIQIIITEKYLGTHSDGLWP
jgi:hypothetical protein